MRNHVTEIESERRSRAHHGSKGIRLVSTTACKQQRIRLYRYHTSEMWSFEGSEFTFSVDRMYGECQNGLVYSTSIDLLFVRVMPRQHRSSWHATRDFAYQALLPLFSVQRWKAGNGPGNETNCFCQWYRKWGIDPKSIKMALVK